MSVYIFTGPTISASEANRELEAIYLPPAAEGDVYRVSLKRPQAIGIIDGYFQSVPAVRHKEILWAMSHGIHVFGSASIGALRAAELAAFGMEGVGIVFKLYRDGVLEDDDEVAIAHGPAEVGFQAGSEAMVNVRQTLKKAEMLGVVSKKFRTAVEKEAKKLFYPDRNYPSLLSCASKLRLPKAELSRFQQWWPRNRVNQKREDAIAMLRLMRQRLAQGLKPKTISYCFEHTAMWESVWGQRGEVRFDSDNGPTVVGLESLLNELRLEGNGYRQHSLVALERFFAIQEAARLRMTFSNQDRRRTKILFCRERGLMNATQIEQWLKDNDLNDHQFEALITDEARVRWIEKRAQFASLSRLPEQLRVAGIYPRLAARAIAKDRLLASLGLKNASLKDWNLTEDRLLHWYFEELLCQPLPDDPKRYARDLGFTSLDAFNRALLKEYLYRRFENQTKYKDHGGPRLASDPGNGGTHRFVFTRPGKRRALGSADHLEADRTLDQAEAGQE